jgi:hypothetical protein
MARQLESMAQQLESMARLLEVSGQAKPRVAQQAIRRRSVEEVRIKRPAIVNAAHDEGSNNAATAPSHNHAWETHYGDSQFGRPMASDGNRKIESPRAAPNHTSFPTFTADVAIL